MHSDNNMRPRCDSVITHTLQSLVMIGDDFPIVEGASLESPLGFRMENVLPLAILQWRRLNYRMHIRHPLGGCWPLAPCATDFSHGTIHLTPPNHHISNNPPYDPKASVVVLLHESRLWVKLWGCLVEVSGFHGPWTNHHDLLMM